MQGEIIAMALGLSFTAIVVGVFITVFIVIAKKTRAKKTQDEYAARYREKLETYKETVGQKAGLDSLREKQQTKSEAYKHELHQQDAREHDHLGEEEHYEEIVGSLGEINDEGCGDLSGVRFIAHDLAYELGDGAGRDYTKLAQAMVMGEIINTPRFKNPYHKR